MKPNQWILSGDTGTSSKTIWAVMTDSLPDNPKSGFHFDIPHDPADFGRCYRLLKLFPEWRHRLGEVAFTFPKWGPMVERWSEMEALYEEELPSGKAPKLYDLMQKLKDEGMIRDGWRRTSLCGWEKTNQEK